MENLYTLENLVLKFKSHSAAFKKSQDKLKKDYKENFPNEKFPNHLNDDFDLPLALSAICIEVINLKKNRELKK